VTGDAQAPAAGATPITPGKAGRVSSSLFEPSDPASVPVHTNGATVRIGGDDGGISDDDVDVPPFMRH
jgi:cell division protein FtsZ